MNVLKEIWKENKWGFLTSGIIVTLGSLFFYVKSNTPLEITIPSGWLMVLVFMFGFSFLLGGSK